MSAAHSPGPWMLGGTHRSPCDLIVPGKEYECIAKIYLTDQRTRKRTPEAGANARLIAAAPELLESLRGLIHAVCGGMESQFPLTDPRHPNYEAYMAARAALAKAVQS